MFSLKVLRLQYKTIGVDMNASSQILNMIEDISVFVKTLMNIKFLYCK